MSQSALNPITKAVSKECDTFNCVEDHLIENSAKSMSSISSLTCEIPVLNEKCPATAQSSADQAFYAARERSGLGRIPSLVPSRLINAVDDAKGKSCESCWHVHSARIGSFYDAASFDLET